MDDPKPVLPPSLTVANIAATTRHIATTFAGVLIGAGIMTSQEIQGCVTEFIHGLSTQAEESGGGVVLALTLGWSFWQKWKQKQAVADCAAISETS